MYRSNDEELQNRGFDFTEQSVRHGFIRKVYSILMYQMTVSIGMICLFLYHEDIRIYVQSHNEVMWSAFFVTFVLVICIACFGELRRKTPLNYIFLALFTIAHSVTLGIITSTYSSEEVLLATVITTMVCLGLTLFAFQTKYDFTGIRTILLVALVILIVGGIMFSYLGESRIKTIVYASIVVFLFSIYLIHDTQIMIGGKHKYNISPEEYIFAALQLYVDIILILMNILNLIVGTRS